MSEYLSENKTNKGHNQSIHSDMQSETQTETNDLRSRLALSGITNPDLIIEAFRAELEKKNKELKMIKKDTSVLSREQTKLQAELKTKNETISSLINQNFKELDTIKSKHQDVIANVSTSYDTNLKMIENRYKVFRKSFDHKLKDVVDTHYKFSNEKGSLLSNQNKVLITQVAELQKDLIDKDQELRDMRIAVDNINRLNLQFQTHDEEINRRKEILESQLNEVRGLYDNSAQLVIQYDKTIKQLQDEKLDIMNQIDNHKKTAERSTNRSSELEKEISLTKATYGDIHTKYTLVLNDNVNKQNNLDEKTLEILSMGSKTNEMERKIIILENNKRDLNNKITDMIVECDSIKLELLDKQKQIHQLKAENTLLTDEKVYFMGELNTTKNQLKEIEASLFEKIRLLQEKCNQEINRIKTESENKINEKTEQTDSLISKMKAEMATIVVDKDKQLESLSNHVKSFTNSQYVTINEIEKLKLVNEKLRADQLVVDKRV